MSSRLAANRWPSWRTLSRWIVIPLVVVGAAETVVRRTADRVPRWYAGAADIASRERIDAVLIGSSHVQAAVPVNVFSAAVARRIGKRPNVLNLARGNTTTIEHYLGLRNLIETYPDSLRGVTVFVETPGAVGSSTHWSGRWVNAEQYQIVVDLLRASDVPRLWRDAEEDVRLKAKIVGRFLARDVALLNRRERIRDGLFNEWLPTMVGVTLTGRSGVEVVGDDLRGPGVATSIRTDAAALRDARALAVQFGAEPDATREEVADWSNSVTSDLVTLLRHAGGDVVFFVPPESEVFQRGYRSAAHRANVARFAEHVRGWNACILKPSFDYTDEDLPDLWHLRIERTAEFTEALVNDWLTTCSSPSMRRSSGDRPVAVTD